MRSVLEVFFRQPLRFVVLLALLPAVGVAVEYMSVPKTYQSSSTVWALHRYIIIGATGPETNLQLSPADTQVTALSELLRSASFDQQIAKAANLLPALNLTQAVLANPLLTADAENQEISRKVVVTSQGYNLYSISYTSSSPVAAQRVVQAVISTFEVQSQTFSLDEAKQLLATYGTQLAGAQREVDRTTNAASRYIAGHQGLNQASLNADPHYLQLQSEAQQAQAGVTNIQNNISTINDEIAAQGSSSGGLLKTLDQPQVPILAQSRRKSYLVGGAAGLVLALAACAAYLMMLVRRDAAVYSASELQEATALPVVMQLPDLYMSQAKLSQLLRDSILAGEGGDSSFWSK